MVREAKIPIALLTAYPPGRVPGLRFRIEQYISILEEKGFLIKWIGFFSDKEYIDFTKIETPVWKRAWLFAHSFFRSLLRAVSRGKYAGIYLYREATLLGLPIVEYLWMRDIPVLMDFDDAIWLVDVSEQNRAFGWLKSPHKTAALLRKVRLATVCNEFLAEYARKYAPEVQIIPTTLDTDRYRPQELPPRPYTTIGWSGSLTTLSHLKTAEGALYRLYQKYGERVRFRFIGAPHYRPPFPAEVLPWQASTEIADVAAIDIGLMPLPDNDWSRGKCSFKALLYMAMEIPPVVSPVGMNCEVVQDGINGLYASTEDEWVEKISLLIENPQLRREMGVKARETVIEKYSVRANASKYIAAFQKVFSR